MESPCTDSSIESEHIFCNLPLRENTYSASSKTFINIFEGAEGWEKGGKGKLAVIYMAQFYSNTEKRTLERMLTTQDFVFTFPFSRI